jgi:hypothetical protein
LIDLTFTECSSISDAGNNIHIQSTNTGLTGLAIWKNENEHLLTVKDSTSGLIITDLYTSHDFDNFYMGIDN